MPDFEIWEGGGDICERLASEIEGELREMWKRQSGSGKEQAMAFGLNGSVSTSGIIEGDGHNVDEESVGEIIDEVAWQNKKMPERMGIIHTHPPDNWAISSLLSPADYINHLHKLQEWDNYDTSLVMTEHDGELVLFGVTSDSDEVAIEEEEQWVTMRGKEINTDEMDPGEVYVRLKEIAQRVLQFSESCRTTVWEV